MNGTAAKEPVRVLLVDDSALARALLRELLEAAPGIAVVGEAANGREAVRLAAELKPDLVTMDLEMPVMDGMAAIEEIMATKALPILVVSGHGDAQTAYAAVAKGALEVVAKPDLDPAGAEELIAKVRMLARVPVITHLRARHLAPAAAPRPAPPPCAAPDPAAAPRLFAIASSTGGPQALAALLPRLPAPFPCPIVVAQHIADGFAAGMAEWLDGLAPLPVRLAADGEAVAPGTVYLSPSERHLTITPARRFALRERAAGDIYRPSCNTLLAAAAEVYGHRAVGIILTGMGSDGVAGMERIFRAGGTTLAQDEASSVIFGMNKVAIDRGWVQRVVSLDAMAGEMARLAAAEVSP